MVENLSVIYGPALNPSLDSNNFTLVVLSWVIKSSILHLEFEIGYYVLKFLKIKIQNFDQIRETSI
jgi:hypothetical protein